MTTIWDPVRVGRMTLKHRLAMSPLTRSRALSDGTPGPLAAEYYAQRASLGLLITEGTQPSEDGQGFPNSPGIHTEAHVAGWRKVADAVHAKGGHLFIQLMHAGRMSHPANTPHGRQAVAPSAIAPNVELYTPSGMLPVPVPRALTQVELLATVSDFRRAAAMAVEAGADGVEIHGANGYLIQQFLAPNANTRMDNYGGSIPNRIRFAMEVAAAVSAEIGADRTAIRLSPGSRLGGIDEGEHYGDVYRHLVGELAKLDLAYLHLAHGGDESLLKDIRAIWRGILLVNRINRPIDAVGKDIEAGLADMAPIGRWALANPDAVDRLRAGEPMNEADQGTFYGGGAEGYTDYPRLTTSNVAARVA
ncbi:N-ethylmaleimide reductase [Cupriavidus phytorum]|uniref:N-ethylmaleimide reductase n=2 Tax=Cupriavidus TaxID=106589 RepID=A0A975WTA1_9BURK|nr:MULTISPECIES: alkene reductase [Cupriavidus]PZX28222.1 2,4-dienoyl-CoA reductase-like NADH-dependent reductase (Old Yellow Enzyme family) [Cupriavidus alkaliphilus]SOY42135.1 N-ethylmaleimide reductase [Cupriavidus taiwanensis]